MGKEEEILERYRILFNQSLEAIYLFDPETKKVIEANPAFLRFLGYTPEEASELTIHDFIAHDAASIDSHIQHILESGGTTIGERKWRRKDGSMLDVSITANKIQYNNKAIVFAAARDITERKKIEQALKESEEKYRRLVQTLPDIVYQVDENGMFVFVNNAIRQLGYEPEELIGKHFEVIIHPEDFKRVSRELILPEYKGQVTGDEKAPKLFDERRTRRRKTSNLELRVLSKGEEECSNEVRLMHKDSHIRMGLVELICEVSSSGYYTPNAMAEEKRFEGSIGIIRDVTERKKIEEQYYLMQRMSCFGILAKGIAHDWGNLLAAIYGNIQLAQGCKDMTEQARFFEIAATALKNADQLVKQFERLSHAQVSKKSNVDVYDAAKVVFDSFPDEGIDKIIDIKPKEYFIVSNESDIKEVLINLLSNSLQAITDKGRCEEDYIRISAEEYTAEKYDSRLLQEGKYVHITFEDSGKGMSQEVRQHAFEPFFSTKKEPAKKGHGLGLTMVYTKIVLQNRGYIEVESDEGKGAKFHIYLPKGL
jgi:PAS domain S-box-containing protein